LFSPHPSIHLSRPMLGISAGDATIRPDVARDWSAKRPRSEALLHEGYAVPSPSTRLLPDPLLAAEGVTKRQQAKKPPLSCAECRRCASTDSLSGRWSLTPPVQTETESASNELCVAHVLIMLDSATVSFRVKCVPRSLLPFKSDLTLGICNRVVRNAVVLKYAHLVCCAPPPPRLYFVYSQKPLSQVCWCLVEALGTYPCNYSFSGLFTNLSISFILANTEQLHAKIMQMSDRIRYLEEALEALQSSCSSQTHPLLRPDLLLIKTSVELYSGPQSGGDAAVESQQPNAIPVPIGPLFRLPETDMTEVILRWCCHRTPSASAYIIFSLQEPSKSTADGPRHLHIPDKLLQRSRSFPVPWQVDLDTRQSIRDFLPPQTEAQLLCEQARQNALWQFVTQNPGLLTLAMNMSHLQVQSGPQRSFPAQPSPSRIHGSFTKFVPTPCRSPAYDTCDRILSRP
jgi:hypothetical protein